MFAWLRVRPWPRQPLHGFEMVVPSPRQAGQVVTLTNWPKMLRCDCRTCPCPLQVAQVSELVPGSDRAPWQRLHVSRREKSSCFSAPKAASSNSIVTAAARSSPRCAAVARDRRPPKAPPPKKASKMSPMSEKPPKPSKPTPAPFGPACPKRSYFARFSPSRSTSYASAHSLNFASASGSLLRSG